MIMLFLLLGRQQTIHSPKRFQDPSCCAHFRSKGELCAQLTESVHRARSALNEEREKSERLDRKLEAEGRAAKKGRFI